MGYGSYRASDWTKLKQSRGINNASGAEQIFKDNRIQDKYNPKFIEMRESCDSADSPLSTPIIIGFDVTGSMGYLAAEIAKNSLNKTITYIYDKQPVTNPHVMCAPFTSPVADTGLQVTQFEADIRVVEQLLELKVGMGGNRYSYDSLVWYFAAKHTRTDCFEKRGKKGFIFCVGDEVCGGDEGERLSAYEIKSVFGDSVGSYFDLEELRYMASQKYEIFHIVTGYQVQKAYQTWNKFLPGRNAALSSKNIDCLSEVITSIMQMANGTPREDVINQWQGSTKDIVRAAIAGISL